MGITVLSLFDGISCGQVALQRAGIKVDRYLASEVDKYAIKITQKNFPNTEQLGDVKNVWAKNLPKIDLLIGGSPCQDLSIAKVGRKGLDGERSGLFWHYVRLLRTCKPKYFLLENVASMSKDNKQKITEVLGVEPIMINSALVSAQQRKRYYWTNWHVEQPLDKGILLKDVLESGTGCTTEHCARKICNTLDKVHTLMARDYKGFGNQRTNGVLEPVCVAMRTREDEKATVLTASYDGAIIKNSLEKKQRTMIFNPYNNKINTKKCAPLGTNPQCQTSKCGQLLFKPLQLVGGGQAQRVYDVKGKSICLSANGGGGGAKTGLYKIDLPDGQYTVRKLTPVECERLQTLSDNYTEGISATQRYKCIGNGWTVDVIAHIFRFIKEW